jgi:hypothetical protein
MARTNLMATRSIEGPVELETDRNFIAAINASERWIATLGHNPLSLSVCVKQSLRAAAGI